MNLELFTRLIEHEAEGLYLHSTTPETFMIKIKTLIHSLRNGNKCGIISDNELVEIIVSSEPQKHKGSVKKNSFFDIVDLSMYRAN